MNITLNIDEDIVKKVRKIAIDKDTTAMKSDLPGKWRRSRTPTPNIECGDYYPPCPILS